MVNERSIKCAVSAFVNVEKNACETAMSLFESILDVVLDACELGDVIPSDDPHEWFHCQLAKISVVLSDSCNAAVATSRELIKIIEDRVDDEGFKVIRLDCW